MQAPPNYLQRAFAKRRKVKDGQIRVVNVGDAPSLFRRMWPHGWLEVPDHIESIPYRSARLPKRFLPLQEMSILTLISSGNGLNIV